MNMLLILSAKLVNQELKYRFGDIPSALIPFRGETIIDIIYQENRQNFDKIVIVGGENKEQLKRYISNNNLERIDLIESNEFSDLASSVLSLHQNYTVSDITNLSIIFGDTYLNSKEIIKTIGKDIVFTSKVVDSSRWTVLFNNKIYDKIRVNSNDALDAFIGLFSFTKPKYFLDLLLNESFYNAFAKYWQTFGMEFLESKTWVDVGHEDNYIKSKKNKARYFNSIDVDYERGILKKTSSEKDKFIHEIQWYLRIPNRISYLTPRIFSYSLDYNAPYIEMEYYSYETLHERYIYGNLNLFEWKIIFLNLLDKLKVMEQYKLSVVKSQISKCLKKMYIDKTKERLKKLQLDKRFDIYFEKEIIKINGREYENLSKIITKIEFIFEKLNIEKIKNFNIIHGDYFFANILYDSNNNIIRLIDPRGDFGGFGIYGDKRYDLAKLLHSVEGKYDLIVEDLFKISYKEAIINYEFLVNNNQLDAEKAFMETLLNEKCTIFEIKFIEATLFLSMIPLHSDNFNRQLLMMARGIELLGEVERNIK